MTKFSMRYKSIQEQGANLFLKRSVNDNYQTVDFIGIIAIKNLFNNCLCNTHTKLFPYFQFTLF